MKINGTSLHSCQAMGRLNPVLRCLGGIMLLTANSAMAREYYFSPSSLEGEALQQQNVDLSLFSRSGAQLPGAYLCTVVLNKDRQDDETISFIGDKQGQLEPQITPAMLRRWGVKVDRFPALAALPAKKPLPGSLDNYIPFAVATFDFETLTLRISMPQEAINSQSRGYIDPSRWDDGMPVAFADYAFSGTQNEGHATSNRENQYLNLRSGINIGGWRARNYSTWNKTDDASSWRNINTYLQHDIDSLKAQFTAGENSTQGEVFDSLQYRGVNIASDEEMLPYSQRGFAPVIRGIASTNAEVSVRQNGYVIYQQNVAPGAFEINDIYSTTNSGDLEVTVKEADGTEHRFTQPYSSVAVMQRPGKVKYEMTAGRYRAGNNNNANEPLFVQGSAIYGVNNLMTLFGGLTHSQDYQAINGGTGVTLGELGTVSADVTAAWATLDNGKQSNGQSYRLLYSGKLTATETNFTLASYRYSTEGYYSFEDANQKYDDEDNAWLFRYNKRNRLQASISQNLLGSSLYLTGYQQDYWATDKKERSVSAGVSTLIGKTSVHLAWTYSKATDSESDQMISLSLSVPLGEWLPRAWANYNFSDSKQGYASHNLGINGTLLDDERLSYSLQQSHTNHDGADNSSLYGGYRSQYANLNAGYYYSSDSSRQFSYGVNGGLVAHPNGITLSQPLGDQFAIVNANGASGIRFVNQRGVATDWQGNAIIPSLTAYQENSIRIDTTSLPEEVDTDETAVTVVPSRSAAVSAQFTAHVGYRALIRLRRPDGNLIPFGAMATSESPAMNAIVDDTGTLYLAGVPEQFSLKVKWGNDTSQTCYARVQLDSAKHTANPAGIRTVEALCEQEQHRGH